jgi:hypothetical protein
MAVENMRGSLIKTKNSCKRKTQGEPQNLRAKLDYFEIFAARAGRCIGIPHINRVKDFTRNRLQQGHDFIQQLLALRKRLRRGQLR